MKIICFVFFLFMGSAFYAEAQKTHYYTLASNQPTALSVDAGEDIHTSQGEPVMLGGDPVANGGTPPYNYSWAPSQDLSDQQEANPFVTAGPIDKTFTVTVTDARGCSATDDVTLFSLMTSLAAGSKTPFDVYPNPADALLTVQTGRDQGAITLIDCHGKEVLKEPMMPFVHSVDIRSFPRGIYMLKIQNDQTEHTVRIVIQ